AVLGRLIQQTEKACAAGTGPVRHLAPLWRLSIEDAAAAGRDPVMLVVSQVERVLRGRLPAAFADQLLLHWQSDTWTEVNLARLPVLLCERAFDAGLEVPDLSELEQLAPALSDALHSEDTDGLARLRLLWTLRMGRPWERCGPAATVFELAIDPIGSR